MSNSNQPREFLSLRDNWQAEANQRGRTSESKFDDVMSQIFATEGFDHYVLHRKVRHLKRLYGPHNRWGVVPDSAVENTRTNRTVFVEVKRQRAAGNAHERACKFFAPGLVTKAQEVGNIRPEHYPFFWIFTNGMVESEKYRSEISFWFNSPKSKSHYFLWDKMPLQLLDFFQNNMRPVLD